MTLTKPEGAERLLQVLFSSFNFKTHYEDSKHKSEICRAAFQASSSCKFKTDCDFAHDIRELRPRVFDFANFKRQKCCNWATGCQYSTRCLYIHDEKSYEIDTGMILLHSHKERKFRIVRDQGDGTVCVFTLHSDGKPKDSLGKTVINSLWSFVKGKYKDIKLPPGVKIPLKNTSRTCIQCPKQKRPSKLPENIKKTPPQAKLVPANEPQFQQAEINTIIPKAAPPCGVVGYAATPSPPMDPCGVILPAPVRQFTSHRAPPGFATGNTASQSVYLKPMTLPPTSFVPAEPLQHKPYVAPLAQIAPASQQSASTLDHKAPPYIPGKQWVPAAMSYGTYSPLTLPTYNPSYSPPPTVMSSNAYTPYQEQYVTTYRLRSSPSPPMTFSYSASPPFGPFSPQYYSIADPTRLAYPGTSVLIPNESEPTRHIPPEMPPNGVLLPPAISHSPVTTPQKQIWEEEDDQLDQKEESPLSNHSPVSKQRPPSVCSSSRRNSPRNSVSSRRSGSWQNSMPMRKTCVSPKHMLQQKCISRPSSPFTEEHKSPECPVKQGVFDPLLMELDETKGLLKILGEYQNNLKSQDAVIKKLEEENARLRQEYPRY